MSRVTTHGNYQSALLDMMAAQNRSFEAQKRVSTQKNATDLVGFGRESAAVNALRSSHARINSFVEVGKIVNDRLTAQDLALGRIQEAATNARLAIANAIAAGRTDGLEAEIEIQFQIVQDALNTKHQGQYLFSGGVMDQPPVSTTNLAGLAGSAVASAFQSGELRQASRLDENVVMDTGFIAHELGTQLFGVFQSFAQNAPFAGAIDGATDTFLTGIMQQFEQAATGLVNEQAKNGTYQQRVEKLITDNEVRADAVEVMLGGKTDADLAKAVTDLEMSQLALQAAAQVINQLRQVSLLDYLR
ncbi:flagellin [uncultured Brevundimonas sp.]|uniref:flagellin n=1 Tax=uncultured Brevundimonas sp. TaxID=213418 RepID=UPI00262707E6|nr:flagellin [uncultured Brevundimonas sp.]